MTTHDLGEERVGKLGNIYLGGAGNNILFELLKDLNPAEYPDFYHLGANTDVQASRDKFGVHNKAILDPWIQARRLSFHSIGNDVTQGYGSGALIEVGRRAAESEESIKAFRDFMEPLSEVRILGGASGGTSGGAFPVVAKLARDMGKAALAIPIMPRKVEHRDILANKVLTEVRSYVPVMPIQNRYIEKLMYALPEDELRKFDLEEHGYKVINRYSIIQCNLTDREIIQVPGDMKNFDQADKRTAYSLGNHVHQGIVEFDSEERAASSTPEELVRELLAGRCQDPEGYKNGEALIYWAHGPWPFYLIDRSQELLCNAVFGENWVETDVPRFHWGWRKHVTDGRMFIAVQVITKKGVEDKAKIENRPALYEALPISIEKETVELMVGGHERTMLVRKDQALRYKKYWPDSTTPVDEVMRLREEIHISHQTLIDPPTWWKEDEAAHPALTPEAKSNSSVH